MFTPIKKSIVGLAMSLLVTAGYAQKISVSEAEVRLSKNARKLGSYFGGGYDHEKNEMVAIFTYPDKKQGTLFDIYRFNENNKALEPEVGLTVEGLAGNLNYESTNTDLTSNESYDGTQVILVRSNFIGRELVIEKGHLEHEQHTVLQVESMSNPFKRSTAWTVDKLIYETDDKEKIDIDFMPIGTLVTKGGYPAEVQTKIQSAPQEAPSKARAGVLGVVGAMADQFKDGISAVKAGLNSAFMKEGGQAVVIGRVVEKVSIRNPVPYNNNRLRVATVDASSMTAEEKGTYLMPFAFIPAETKAIDGFQKMVALLVPLNSPNSVKEAKQYQMDKENRNRVMLTIVNANGELTDTTEYRSAGNDGKYAIKELGDAVYIPAVVDADKNGFYSGFVNKPTHFQITKVENGEVAFNSAYNFEEIEDKVVVPQGEKFKKLKVGTILWHEMQELANGDVVFFANDEDNFYAFQVDQKGELKALYLNDRYDTKGKIVDSQFIVHPQGQTYWMTRETPEGVVDTEFNIQESISSYNYGYSSGTVTTATATPRNVLEIKSVTKIAAVNTSSGTLSAQAVLGGKDYLVVGDTGFLLDENGNMLMIGYDLAKKKTLYSLRLTGELNN